MCRVPSNPNADVAQLAEQLFCKQQVRSSSLLVGSQKCECWSQFSTSSGAILAPPLVFDPDLDPDEKAPGGDGICRSCPSSVLPPSATTSAPRPDSTWATAEDVRTRWHSDDLAGYGLR